MIRRELRAFGILRYLVALLVLAVVVCVGTVAYLVAGS